MRRILPSIWHAIASNLRYKLLLLVLLPVLLLAPTVLGLASFWTWQYTYQQLFLKVNTDLSVAHDTFFRIQTYRQRELMSLADSYAFRSDFESDNFPEVVKRLDQMRQVHSFDFINLLSEDASQKLGSDGWTSWQTKSSPLEIAAVENGQPAVGIEIYSQEEIRNQDSSLADLVVLPLVETPRAVPTDRATEDRAMVIRVLHPVLDREGKQMGILEGGVLLNRNFRFVDEIRDLVYAPGNLAAGSLGTVTVFLDDVRVSTNVPGVDKQRALGTRVSKEVRTTVLENREVWINRAFVVNDWYISAYEPIIDVNGNSVGMLYAGYLELPHRTAMVNALIGLATVLFIGTVLAAIAAIVGAQSIFRPIESIANVVRATQSGYKKRIGVLQSEDEIGELARQFDTMLDTLEENQRRIESDAYVLELKVAERTSELSDKNRRLEATITLLRETRQQLAMAEKLAALGELTAGVAHEINNPIAVILGNMDVVIAEMGDDHASVQTEIDLIIEQIYRIRSIVDRLLQYSRPSSYAGYVEDVDVSSLLEKTLLLVKHEVESKQIKIIEHYAEFDPIGINRQELQQVLVNLVINASHAVETGGEISIKLESWEYHGVKIRIRDNGVGIPAAEIRRVFDPFYTTGKEEGTGLGLSVSYGIIRRYGGQITVDSLLGEWTEFVVKLRFEPIYESDEELLQELNSTA